MVDRDPLPLQPDDPLAKLSADLDGLVVDSFDVDPAPEATPVPDARPPEAGPFTYPEPLSPPPPDSSAKEQKDWLAAEVGKRQAHHDGAAAQASRDLFGAPAPVPTWSEWRNGQDAAAPPAPEAEPPRVGPAVAGTVGAAALGASADTSSGSRRGRGFFSGLFGGGNEVTPPPKRIHTRNRRGKPLAAGSGSEAALGGADPDTGTPDATPATPATPEPTPASTPGRGGRRRGHSPGARRGAPRPRGPVVDPDDLASYPAMPVPAPVPAPAPAPRPATPAMPTPSPLPAPYPTPAPPRASGSKAGEFARNWLSAAGIAVNVELGRQAIMGGVKNRLQIRGENPGLLKTVNILGGVAVAARLGWGVYAAYKGYGTGQVNHEAMQMIGENLPQDVPQQAGGFTDSAIDAASLNMEPVAYEAPIDDTSERPGTPAIDPGDIAPEPVELGEWKGKNSSEGTVWGTTMDYLEEMGVDTDDMTGKEKYEIVDDMLEANDVGGEDATKAERWDAAEDLSSNFKVNLPSANDMEDILDAHGVDHGELDPIVEKPAAPAPGDTAPGTDPGADSDTKGNNGSSGRQHGDAPATPEPTAEPTSSPSTPTPSPSTSTPAPADHMRTANSPGNWGAAGHEVLDAIWQSAAAYAGTGIGGGTVLAGKEAVKERSSTPTPPTPRRRSGRGGRGGRSRRTPRA